MNILGTLKSAAGIIVSVGAGAVVSNAIKASTPADAKIIQKISIAVGGLVLSSMVGDMASKYATEKIDETIDELKQTKDAISDLKNN